MKPKNLNVINNNAYIRNYNLVDIANKYGTPLMVFDEFELKDNIQMFKNGFNSQNVIAHTVYASKAFLTSYIVKLINNFDLWIDAVSLGDLYIIKQSGFPMNHIMFHGNNKSKEEINFAIENNVNIVVDNIHELKKIVELANNKQVNTMFRINPGIEAHTHEFVQTATSTSKFGESIFDKDVINEMMQIYLNHSNVILHGFHSHIGSQILDVKPFIANVQIMTDFSYHIMNEFQYELDYLNFGGGFGIDYTGNQHLDINNVLQMMVNEFDSINQKYGNKIKNIFIEPGRSLLGNSCVTLYSVGSIKQTYGHKNYCFIDGGMADNIRPALYDAEYCADIANKMNDQKILKVDLSGKCCESGDVLIHDLMVPQLEENDIVMVYSTFAYTYSMSSNYNNMLKIAVVALSDVDKLIVNRQKIDDLTTLFNE